MRCPVVLFHTIVKRRGHHVLGRKHTPKTVRKQLAEQVVSLLSDNATLGGLGTSVRFVGGGRLRGFNPPLVDDPYW